MKRHFLTTSAWLITACTLFLLYSGSATAQSIEYLSPRPGSTTVPVNTIIVLRSSQVVTRVPETLHRSIVVTGTSAETASRPRSIPVRITATSDGRTLNISPLSPLHELETVVVSIRACVGLPDTTFRFRTARMPDRQGFMVRAQEEEERDVMTNAHGGELKERMALKLGEDVQADTLPTDFPPITVTTNNGATPLDLYVAPNSRVTPEKYGRFSMALDTAGGVKSYKRLSYWPFDFKVLPNGRLSISRLQVFSGVTTESKIYVMDSAWVVRDSIQPRNGYLTSAHDHTVLPNGHIVVQAWEDVIMDLSQEIPGGNPAALVVQGIIQELDQDRNVVFQWRTLEHIPVTDSYEDLTAASIRYAHNNAIWVDHDGDMLVSLRHCSSVIRIDRQTGEVEWVMGGKRNQFTFSSSVAGVTDAEFSYQHDVRRTKRGLSLFDNGNLRTPQYSRAVEYKIDEVQRTAELIWTYRHAPDIFVSIQGCVQTLANGHRVVTWGSAAADGHPGVTEVDSNGVVVFEAMFPKELFLYRAQRHQWPAGRPSDSVFKDEVLPLNTYTYADADDTLGITVTYTSFTSVFYNATIGKRYAYAPVNPRFDGVAPNVYPLRISLEQEGISNSVLEIRFNLDVLGLSGTSGYEVYHRPIIGSGTFTKQLTQFTPDRRTLVVTGTDFGEFLIADAIAGVVQPLAPIALSPSGGVRRKLLEPQTLRVVSRGVFDSLEIQASTDDAFSQIINTWFTREDKVSLTTSLDTPGMRYWRVRAFHRGSVSDWSQPALFELTAPFLTLTLPIQQPVNKFITFVDKNAPITWTTNASGPARLELLTGTSTIVIKDTVRLENQGFLWRVPIGTPLGTNFAIRITAYADGLTDQSDTVVSVDQGTSVDDEPTLSQSITASPLPASSSITLAGEGLHGVTSVMLFGLDGLMVQSMTVDGSRADGGLLLNVQDLASGSYHCVLISRSHVASVPIVIAR